jgi:CRP/FNR family transcriptional regulator
MNRIFCGLAVPERRRLDQIGVSITLPSGAILHREGDLPDSVGIVCDGQVKLSCSSRSGKSLILRIAGPGDVLGLGAIVAGKPHETTAEAISPARIKVIPREALLRFMRESPEAGYRTAATLASEYEIAFLDAKRLALCTSAESRLSRVLLDWARPASRSERVQFKMTLSHTELGELAGLSRETVTRTLAALRRRKLIEVAGATLRIPDPAKLEALCD